MECILTSFTSTGFTSHDLTYLHKLERFSLAIVNFHSRFNCEFGLSIDRWNMLFEETKEYRDEIKANSSYTTPTEAELEEVADVAFVALGTLHLAKEAGILALDKVARKNNSKNETTHFKNSETGKITKRPPL